MNTSEHQGEISEIETYLSGSCIMLYLFTISPLTRTPQHKLGKRPPKGPNKEGGIVNRQHPQPCQLILRQHGV